MRFDGRVAIVTGAGGAKPSLGRSYAWLLAERGARVVVNDLGVGPDGRGLFPANAEEVADEIVEAGGEAVADLNSVADEEGARAIVRAALDTWGRVDILINNAGVALMADFAEITTSDIHKVVNAHLMGNIWMCRAVWPHMCEADYGRIVNVTSGGMFGQEHLVIYGAAKGGIFGLTRGLAVEGARHNIRVNALGPAAGTASTHHMIEESPWLKMMDEKYPPHLVAPVAVFLSHESCELSGAFLEAAGGSVSARMFGKTAGYHNPQLTVEDVRGNLNAVLDKSGFAVTTDPRDPVGGTRPEVSKIIHKPYRPE